MINLFNIRPHVINTSMFPNWLCGDMVTEFEENFAQYVGAKYCVSLSSASAAIFLLFLGKNLTVKIPSVIPPVVPNHLINAGNRVEFTDNVDWIGNAYVLDDWGWENRKIIDSAQEVGRDQFKKYNKNDAVIYSFYPTKPVGSCDGGAIVSNDETLIDRIRLVANNGMQNGTNNWEKKLVLPGYKMYMNCFQAYIANENLKELDNDKLNIEVVRDKYDDAFDQRTTSYHLYTVQVADNEVFLRKMKEDGIICGIHYKACHLDPVYIKYYTKLLPYSEHISETTASIPLHGQLSTKDVDYIIRKVKEHRNAENV